MMSLFPIAPVLKPWNGRQSSSPQQSPIAIRQAEGPDAEVISELVTANVGRGLLLPRTAAEITQHVSRFLVATRDERVLGCGELAPLTLRLTEVRSLVVAADARGSGFGTQLLAALVATARRQGIPRLCAFTHVPRPFVGLGFAIVPHTWLPEKIMTDCQACEWFRRCEQYAVVFELTGRQGGPRRMASGLT